MIKVGLISICLIVLVACGESEPVATTYKKSIGTGAPAPATGTGTVGTGDATAAALVKQGQDLYATKCAACHGAIAASAKKSATAARITAAATITSHATVKPYPVTAEITALEAALK